MSLNCLHRILPWIEIHLHFSKAAYSWGIKCAKKVIQEEDTEGKVPEKEMFQFHLIYEPDKEEYFCV